MAHIELAPERLFLAFWPPASFLPILTHYAQTLQQLTGGRIIPPPNFHVTLLFLDQITSEQKTKLIERLSTVKAASFIVYFNRLEIWKNGIAALRCETPSALQHLYERLTDAAQAIGVKIEPHVFKPHITLLHKAETSKQPLLTMENSGNARLYWTVQDFSLVRSIQPSDGTGPSTGSIYQVIQHWPLSA